MIKDKRIDHGREFDWGKASEDYAKYRDIYPPAFYQKILDLGFCIKGQKVLDLGTGTGVLPRNLYQYGAEFTGTDISAEQIEQAKKLADEGGMEIEFRCLPAEAKDFADDVFDIMTACQCFFYFDHPVFAPQAKRMLKDSGKLILLYMAWLPFEDAIAGKSEELVLKYNPSWTGCKEMRHSIVIPEVYHDFFAVGKEEVFDIKVPFTRESWNGRMKACRGIGASLSEEDVKRFDEEHMALLENIAPTEFQILHYVAISVLNVKF